MKDNFNATKAILFGTGKTKVILAASVFKKTLLAVNLLLVLYACGAETKETSTKESSETKKTSTKESSEAEKTSTKESSVTEKEAGDSISIPGYKEGMSLYRNCYNELAVESSLGEKFNPKYSATGASLLSTSSKNGVCVIPVGSGSDVALTVKSSEYTKTFNFKVIPTPKPTVFLVDSKGKPLTLKESINMPAAMRVVIKPDEGFARLLPKETIYRLVGGTITQYSGDKAIKILDFSGSSINTGDFQAQKGNSFTVTITGVERLSQSGAIEEIKDLPGAESLSFTIK